MKRVLLIIPLLFAMNSFSQNLIQNNINFSNNRFVQAQTQQVFASNIKVNDNNINKPVRANANPQVNNVQRVSTANTVQRRQRRVTPQTNINISNPIQVNTENVSNKNINDDVQLYVINQMDNNVGNAFGNENIIEQLASVNIPAIQLGTGSLNLNLNLPTIKLPSIKFKSRNSVSTSKHKSHTFKKKLAKLNRNLGGKLSFKKKLKIKVDNCFKW